MKKELKIIISCMAGFLSGGYISSVMAKDVMKPVWQQSDNILRYYRIFDRWLSLRQRNISLDAYFRNHGYRSVAIYGVKELGCRLLDELQHTDIEVVCMIDQMTDGMDGKVRVITPEDEIPKADVIVVTASYYFESISAELKKKTDCPVISIEEIVYEIRAGGTEHIIRR